MEVNKKKWKEAMLEEFSNLFRYGTFNFVEKPNNRKIIKTKWVFKKKCNERGEIERYRARLVAMGNTQKPGIDYEKTYSPVVSKKSIRLLFGLSVINNWKIHHMDVNAAYLAANLEEKVYMEIPDGLCEMYEEIQEINQELPLRKELERRKWACKLNKSIYGLHQSGLMWNKTLDSFLKCKGFIRCKTDPCVYFNEKEKVIVAVYVDDLLIYGHIRNIEKIKQYIKQHFETKDLGDAKNILSVRVNQSEKSIKIDQEKYAIEILKQTNMINCKRISTPLPVGIKYTHTSDVSISEEKQITYRKIIGSILYLATTTRPDLIFPATFMSQFNNDPKEEVRTLEGNETHFQIYKRNT